MAGCHPRGPRQRRGRRQDCRAGGAGPADQDVVEPRQPRWRSGCVGPRDAGAAVTGHPPRILEHEPGTGPPCAWEQADDSSASGTALDAGHDGRVACRSPGGGHVARWPGLHAPLRWRRTASRGCRTGIGWRKAERGGEEGAVDTAGAASVWRPDGPARQDRAADGGPDPWWSASTWYPVGGEAFVSVVPLSAIQTSWRAHDVGVSAARTRDGGLRPSHGPLRPHTFHEDPSPPPPTRTDAIFRD
jgi:hypothetical protein